MKKIYMCVCAEKLGKMTQTHNTHTMWMQKMVIIFACNCSTTHATHDAGKLDEFNLQRRHAVLTETLHKRHFWHLRAIARVVVVVARVTQFVVNDTFAKTSLHISRSQFNIFSKLSSVLRQHIDMRSK